MIDESPLIRAAQTAGASPVLAEQVVAHFGDPAGEYLALTQRLGVVDLGCRTRIELKGDDRLTFLNNFCTNDVRKLEPHRGCEAFLTSVQGRTLGHLLILCRDESLLLETGPGQAERIITHLDKYLIREDVRIVDRSGEIAELLVAGPQAARQLGELGLGRLPAGRLEGVTSQLAGTSAELIRVDFAGPDGFLLFCPGDDALKICRRLIEAGATACGQNALETVRIESGWPMFGRDFDDQNLPQEIARDAAAISFTKGCYLGQETVARLDALGHVNRTLVGVRFDQAKVPDVPLDLMADGKSRGQLTSVIFSPKLAAPLGLALVHSSYNRPGSRLESHAGTAEVIDLPVNKAD